MKWKQTVLWASLICYCFKANTHLYCHYIWSSRSIRVWVAPLRGQQPVVRSKWEKDEHSCQRPKEPRKKQRHTKLHGPRLSSYSATGFPHSVWLSSPTTESACDKLRQKVLLLSYFSTSTEWDGLLFCPDGLCWITGFGPLSCPSVCVMGGQGCAHDSLGPYWGLQPTHSHHHHPLGYFWGLIEGTSLWVWVCGAVGECEGRGISAEITGGNWTPSFCMGMSGQGETERTEEE